MKKYLLCMLAFCFAADALAAKRDFRGLFGSYRREKFTENEARQSDFGVDLILSTLVPITSIVKSVESVGGAANSLLYSTFFNVEGAVHYSFNYHWQAFASFGYYTYDTRKENSLRNDPTLPLFHQFEMTAFPILGGVKYRFSTSDIVPYVGVGLGVSFVRRKAFYDYSSVLFDERYMTAFTGEAIFGFEFYFSARSGIRLETSAYFMAVPAGTFTANGSAPSVSPHFEYSANLISLRYASGLFFLF